MEPTKNNDAALLEKLSFEHFRNEVLKDYQYACESRETSLIGRKEVLTGKAKFGIFGDGKDTCISYPENYTGAYVVGHHYEHSGIYEVCVKILYYGGCESHKCKHIQIGRPDSCKADFERLPVISTNDSLRIYFKALPWHNNNKKPIAICWLFGDGKDTCIKYEPSFTGSYVVPHKYKEPGSYEVCVRITYYGGCESKKCKIIVVETPDKCT